MNKLVAWMLFAGLGVILIAAGVQGRLGSVMAAIITPSALIDSKGGN